MNCWKASAGFIGAVIFVAAVNVPLTAQQQLPASPNQTQIVLLGTGNPIADPDRSGPATAIVVNGTAYLVDFGAGVVRRAKAAAIEKGITALEPTSLRVVFATHLHSDHTVGYSDLILTPWVLGRHVPLDSTTSTMNRFGFRWAAPSSRKTFCACLAAGPRSAIRIWFIGTGWITAATSPRLNSPICL
jgi:ribonuclease BN (tRNA processing enzyme)